MYFSSFFLHSIMLQIPYQKNFFDITPKTSNLEKKVVNNKGGNLLSKSESVKFFTD